MKYISYPPNCKKEYTDANILKAIAELTAKGPDFSRICIRFAWDEELFYPWLELQHINGFNIILLPEYLPKEEKEARKETLRVKRMLKKSFPNVAVRSNLRLDQKLFVKSLKAHKKNEHPYFSGAHFSKV